MAAITVKRKPKIGFKEETPQAGEEAPEAAAPEMAQAPVLSRYDNVSDGSSYVFAGICGLIAMFIFLGLLFIQYTEYTYYQDAFVLSGAYVSAPSVAPSAPAARAPAPEPAVAAPAATPASTAPAAAPAPSKDDGSNARAKIDGRNAEINKAIDSK